MDCQNQDAYEPDAAETRFFAGYEEALPLYALFMDRAHSALPDFSIRVQKTQITLTNRHVFGCVSFLRIRHKADMPPVSFTLTFGFDHALNSPRIDGKVEAYPGRWTYHMVISDAAQIDSEVLSWLREAYAFSERKR